MADKPSLSYYVTETVPEPSLASTTSTRKPRPRDETWDALMAACEIDTAQVSAAARGAYNTAVRDLKAIHATSEDIAARAAAFRRQWPNVTLTPTALSRRWSEINLNARSRPSTRIESEEEARRARRERWRAAAEQPQHPALEAAPTRQEVDPWTA